MKQKVRGGSRDNSGRKPVKDKKEPITVYARKSLIAKLGGRKGAIKHIYTALEKVA